MILKVIDCSPHGRSGERQAAAPRATLRAPDVKRMAIELGGHAPVLVFPDAEAVARANATPYGLVAYVWTRGLGRTVRVAEALRFGMVTVNGAPLAPPQAPFGGVKGSGYGREGGHQGVESFLDHKYLSVGLGT